MCILWTTFADVLRARFRSVRRCFSREISNAYFLHEVTDRNAVPTSSAATLYTRTHTSTAVAVLCIYFFFLFLYDTHMPRTRPSPLWYRVAYCARVLKKKCFSVVRPVTFLLFPRRIKHSMSNRRIINNTCTKVYDGRDDFKRFRDFRHTRINISISTGGRLRKINDLIVMSVTVENVQKRYVRLVSECDLINRTILRVDAFFFFFFINTGIVFIILNPIESRYSLSSRSIWRHTHLIKKKHRFIRKTFRVISVPFVRDRPPTQYSSGQANNVFIPLLLLWICFYGRFTCSAFRIFLV